MTLSERLAEYVRACCTGLWIESHEHHDALAEIATLCRAEGWNLATWRVTSGLSIVGQETTELGSDPLSAIQAIRALASADGAAILVLENFHRFLQSAEIVQALAEQILAGKQNRTFIVILAPVVQIPTELEKQFVVLEHELPNREQLETIARGVATEEGELPADDELTRVLDASVGLTRFEAENAYALSLVRHARVTPEVVWSLKAQMLKKSGLLSLHRGQEQFAQLGGLESLKAFCLRSLRQQGNPDPKRRPRGVMLCPHPAAASRNSRKVLAMRSDDRRSRSISARCMVRWSGKQNVMFAVRWPRSTPWHLAWRLSMSWRRRSAESGPGNQTPGCQPGCLVPS